MMRVDFKHPLERGGKNRIHFSVDSWFKNGVLKLDGNEIWRFDSEEAFKRGTVLTLPDNSKLEVQLRMNPANTGPAIYIARDGEPLPKSNFDQQNNFGEVQNFLRAVAAAYVVGGLVSLVVDTGFLVRWTGGSVASLIAGALLLAITFLPDDKKRMAFLAGSVIALLEAGYLFTNVSADGLTVVLRFAAIILPIVCFKLFGDAKRQAEERAARKPAS